LRRTEGSDNFDRLRLTFSGFPAAKRVLGGERTQEDGRFAHFLFVVAESLRSMQLADLIEQAVTGLGYELVEFETSPRARLLRIFIDSPQGVNIDDCSKVSNHLSRLFTVENVDYDRLEVSSPGMDRPLKKAADFERFAGQQVQMRMRLPINGQRNFTGELAGVKDGIVNLQGAETAYQLPLEQIEKARLVPKF